MLDKALGSMASPDQYYFQIRLTTLRCTHTQPFSFRVSIQKGLQKVDNTKDLFTIEGTECSLNEEPLNFYLPSYNPNRPIDFTILLIDQELKPITSFKINSGQFISEYIKSGKNNFSVTDKFQDENYELEYSLFIEKSRGALLSLTGKPSQLQSPKLPDVKSPVKEEPIVQPTRAQITRSPVITRRLTPKPKTISETTSKTQDQPEAIETPIQEPVNETPKPPTRTSASSKSTFAVRNVDIDTPQQPQRTSNISDIKQNKSPSTIRSYKRPQRMVEPEPVKEEEINVEQPKKVEPPKRIDPLKRIPFKQLEEPKEQVKVQQIRKATSKPVEKPVEEVKVDSKKTETSIKNEVKQMKKSTQEKVGKANSAPVLYRQDRDDLNAKPGKESGDSGNRTKLILIALVIAVVIFGLIFAGGSKETKKRPGRKGKD